MSRRTFRIAVTQFVEVTMDASKFDEVFMQEFRDSFFPFHTLEEHAEHIAQLQARGVIDAQDRDEFVEGYGPSHEMGITALVYDAETEVVSP